MTEAAKKLLSKACGTPDVSVEWKRPIRSSHGDIATPVALQLASHLKRDPREIATLLADGLREHPSVERAEVAGAGYVNLWLNVATLLKEVQRSRRACMARVPRKDEAPVIIEGSDPNIAKPLGIHHILAAVIGQCLVNIHRHAGYNVISWNYIGDWGTQFGNLAVAVERWGSSKSTKDYSLDEFLSLYVRFHDEVGKDPSLAKEGRETFRRLEQGDATLKQFWEDVVAITKRALTPLYQRLHVSFDCELGESFYNDKMDRVLEEGTEKGVFREGEKGALIVEFPEESSLPVYVVKKGDGSTLYSTRDLAQMRYRIDQYHPQKILIPTDVSQKLHFEQLRATCVMLGWKLPEFENVLFGRMSFVDKKMSTRKGNILKLEHVLDEAVRRADRVIEEHRESIQTDDRSALAEMMGVGALVYGILSQNRKMDIVFDWDRMLSFDGNSAPYLQYTHARARSVLRKANVKEQECPLGMRVLTAKERELLKTLLQFEQVLEESRTSCMPHILAQYLYYLCQGYNLFYASEPILKADEPLRSLRLALTYHTANVLKTGAELLTVRVPEHM